MRRKSPKIRGVCAFRTDVWYYMKKEELNRCIGCHVELEEGLHFCSMTCACLTGYFSVRTDRKTKDPSELNDPKVKAEALAKPPVREHPKDRTRFL